MTTENTTKEDIKAGPEDDVVLQTRDLSVTFDTDRGTARVLNDVNIEIEREEIISIIGESGSGKSMFASSLLDGVESPGQVSGEVTYYPEDHSEPIDVFDLSEKQLNQFRWERVSFVFQGAMDSFNPTMEIKEHFVETCRAHNKNVEEGLEYSRDLLSDLHLNPKRIMNSYPHELSGGMRQRALIALSLILKPDVLVMDEPTAALDLLMQQSIISLLRKLKKKYNLTLVFITHNVPLVAGLADRLAVMYSFEFVEVGPTETVLENALHPYARGLLKSVPNIQTPIGDMHPIGGTSPDPVNVPSGCSYHPRCPLADDRCEMKDPSLDEHVVGDHSAACFHSEQAKDELPYNLGGN